jgi:hypothetical protein
MALVVKSAHKQSHTLFVCILAEDQMLSKGSIYVRKDMTYGLHTIHFTYTAIVKIIDLEILLNLYDFTTPGYTKVLN